MGIYLTFVHILGQKNAEYKDLKYCVLNESYKISFGTIPATHYSHCFIELSQPKPVYWLIFFPVFHVHTHFI